jgi:hypothetical protein
MINGHSFEFDKKIKSEWPDSINFTVPNWKAWCLIVFNKKLLADKAHMMGE